MEDHTKPPAMPLLAGREVNVLSTPRDFTPIFSFPESVDPSVVDRVACQQANTPEFRKPSAGITPTITSHISITAPSLVHSCFFHYKFTNYMWSHNVEGAPQEKIELVLKWAEERKVVGDAPVSTLLDKYSLFVKKHEHNRLSRNHKAFQESGKRSGLIRYTSILYGCCFLTWWL